MSDLARRLVEHPRWKWMPGMEFNGPWQRWVCVDSTGYCEGPLFVCVSPEHTGQRRSGPGAEHTLLLALESPATQGCIDRMILDAQPTWLVERYMDSGREYFCATAEDGQIIAHDRACALLAAWGERGTP